MPKLLYILQSCSHQLSKSRGALLTDATTYKDKRHALLTINYTHTDMKATHAELCLVKSISDSFQCRQ